MIAPSARVIDLFHEDPGGPIAPWRRHRPEAFQREAKSLIDCDLSHHEQYAVQGSKSPTYVANVRGTERHSLSAFLCLKQEKYSVS